MDERASQSGEGSHDLPLVVPTAELELENATEGPYVAARSEAQSIHIIVQAHVQ